MAPNIPRLRAYLARLKNATRSEKACDVCDAGMPSSTGTYPSTGVETLVTSKSASECPQLIIEYEQQTGTEDSLEEREAMALEGGVSPAFARSFAALQVARPASVGLSRWHQTIHDVGMFLDTWGDAAERLGWTARDVIGPQLKPTALAWALNGAQVISLTQTSASLSDGRTFVRTAVAENNDVADRPERGSQSITLPR
jgi:hypothetical protein